ncbi:MAG: 6-phosphogluconolactonase [Verrucomicrobiales bacterium]|jgi:6-phosphogluconolactonase
MLGLRGSAAVAEPTRKAKKSTEIARVIPDRLGAIRSVKFRELRKLWDLASVATMKKRTSILKAATLAIALILPAAAVAETLVYFGTYTRGESKGIYRSSLNEDTGALSEAVLVAEIASPSFLAIHPNGKFLYAVSEVAEFEAKPGGGVSAYAIGADGGLTLLNQRNSGGGAPCHVSLDPSGKCVMVANYSGGSISVYPIEADGKLGEVGSFVQHAGSSVHPKRQTAPHAHSINPDPSGKRAFVADLGLDQVLIYNLDAANGKVEANDPPFVKLPGATGPRHFSFHPNGKFAFTNLEMTLQIAALSYDSKTGALAVIDTKSTVDEGTPQKGNSTAECLVHSSGKWVYVSNRGANSIAAFKINQDTGKLTPIERESTQGKTPRNFGIDPSGKFLIAANHSSNDVVVFKINQDTGELDPTGHKIAVPVSVCVRFLKK